jgi:ribosome-binding factor A
MASHYQDKLSQNISRYLAVILQREVKDPRVGLVTIADVSLNKDLGVAKVYITAIDQDKTEAARVLNDMAGFLRSKLAAKLSVKFIPELRFYADFVIEKSNKIEKILDEINTQKKQNPSEDINNNE